MKSQMQKIYVYLCQLFQAWSNYFGLLVEDPSPTHTETRLELVPPPAVGYDFSVPLYAIVHIQPHKSEEDRERILDVNGDKLEASRMLRRQRECMPNAHIVLRELNVGEA